MHMFMHELKKEIKEMTADGIHAKDMPVLMQLVDMYKDLKNVCYWDYKMESHGENGESDEMHDYNVSWSKESGMSASDVHAKIEEIKGMVDKASKGMPIDRTKLEKDLEELLDTSEKIHTVVGKVKMPDSMVARFKAIYK